MSRYAQSVSDGQYRVSMIEKQEAKLCNLSSMVSHRLRPWVSRQIVLVERRCATFDSDARRFTRSSSCRATVKKNSARQACCEQSRRKKGKIATITMRVQKYIVQ